MTEILYDITAMYLIALLVWCVACLVWWKVSPKLSDMLERRCQKRRARVLHAENIPGTTGYRIKTR